MIAYLIIVFDSTHIAIKTEKAMKRAKISGQLIPTPGNIRAGCGLSFKVAPCSEKDVLTLLTDEVVDGFEVFKIDKDSNETTIKKLLTTSKSD